MVLPHFAGTGTPYMNPAAVGVIAGLNFNTMKGELYRALMEGVTYEMRLNLDCLEQAGMRIRELKSLRRRFQVCPVAANQGGHHEQGRHRP
ncbi:FGGY-family carbohydrate kinase [Paenibacillus rhizoplanae]